LFVITVLEIASAFTITISWVSIILATTPSLVEFDVMITQMSKELSDSNKPT